VQNWGKSAAEPNDDDGKPRPALVNQSD